MNVVLPIIKHEGLVWITDFDGENNNSAIKFACNTISYRIAELDNYKIPNLEKFRYEMYFMMCKYRSFHNDL